tara:strand:+ start:1786 stop:3297 length:1512 start_codon:yes stop_codon:yes gene_type:complete
MEFFNKKEDVMDIVLTREGREHYASGTFNPTYYAFYDDEIIYDMQYVSGASNAGEQQEPQNNIGRRARDSITLKNQTGWAEAKRTSIKERIEEPFFKTLGRSSPIDENAPAWEINVVDRRGYISGSVEYIPLELSGSGKCKQCAGSCCKGTSKSPYTDITLTNKEAIRKYNKEKIPQLNVFCDYDVRIIDTIDWLATGEERTKLLSLYEKWQKQSDAVAGHEYIQYVQDMRQKYGGEVSLLLRKSTEDILLDFTEHNVEDTDFTLEVYEYVYDGLNNVRELKQLNFSDEEHGPDFVEYYFDLTTDKETEIDLNIKYVQESLELEEEPLPCPPASSKFNIPKTVTAGSAAGADAPAAQPTGFFPPSTGKSQLGDGCTTSDQCESGKCQDGYCVPNMPDDVVQATGGPGAKKGDQNHGTPCIFDQDCKSGKCRGKTCRAQEAGAAGPKQGPGAKKGDVGISPFPMGANECIYDEDCDKSKCIGLGIECRKKSSNDQKGTCQCKKT